MGEALEQAALGLDAGELPIGSVVAADSEVVARAYWHSRNGLLAHPELLALRRANRRGALSCQACDATSPCSSCVRS